MVSYVGMYVCMYVCITCTCLLKDFDEKVCFAITKLCSVSQSIIIHTNNYI